MTNIKTRRKDLLQRVLLAFLLVVTPFIQAPFASAGAITGRKITLSNSVGGATGVSYTLTSSALPTATAVKSVGVQFCTSLTGGCTTPSGFSVASSTLASQPSGLGAASGWTVSTATAGNLRIVNAANATVPSGAVTIQWNGVVNPTATNTTFYAIVTTYSDSAWTTAIDTGSVALSTSAQIQVTLGVGETITFCTGTSITGQNCDTITALSSNTASATGTSQFGINLVSNSSPSVGSAATGTGTATAAANYNTTNSFRFVSGETVASVGVPTNGNAFTVSYIANISGLTPPGAYSTNLYYNATANF